MCLAESSGSGMTNSDLVDAFVQRRRADQTRLRVELQSYESIGMRLWTGRSVDRLRDITEERISAIGHELAEIETTIELVTSLGKFL
jgi:hypothetical protein